MALQVRRGTNAERLGITPLAGELVYTTDTKQLYVGDGATTGGNTSIGNTIDSLLADTTPQLGGPLDLNGNNITGTGNINIDGTITATGNLGSLTVQFNEAWISQLNVENQITAGRINANLIADDSTVVFNASTGLLAASQLTGIATIDINGSIFGDDSATLVDSINSQIVGDINNNQVTTQTIFINQDSVDADGMTFTNISDGASGGNFNFRASRSSLAAPTVLQAGDVSIDLISSGWDGTTFSPSAIIKMGTDKYTSSIGSGVMPGRIVFLTFNEAGTSGIDTAMVFNRQGRLGIATDAPTEKLDVVGNIKASGSIQPGVYADTTARDVAHSSPINGQMIYLTATHKFQGYANGVWVDLN